MNRGFTVIEMAMGVFTSAMLALVMASLFKAGIQTYTYTVFQDKALVASKDALFGPSSKAGILWAASSAQSVSALTSSSVIFVASDSTTKTYSISNKNLVQTKSSSTFTQAVGVSSMTVAYYNMNSSGLIIQSTSAALATMVTTMLGVEGLTSRQRTYYFYSGAVLRNHQ